MPTELSNDHQVHSSRDSLGIHSNFCVNNKMGCVLVVAKGSADQPLTGIKMKCITCVCTLSTCGPICPMDGERLSSRLCKLQLRSS